MGDAFTAGFLYGGLAEDELGIGLRWDAALAALKYKLPGDLPVITRQAVLALIEQSQVGWR